MKLKVYIDRRQAKDKKIEDQTISSLQKIAELNQSPLSLIKDEAGADWYAFRPASKPQWLLIPRSSYQLTTPEGEVSLDTPDNLEFQGVRLSESDPEALRNVIESASRVSNLDRLAAVYGPTSKSDSAPNIALSIMWYPKGSSKGVLLMPDKRSNVRVGDKLQFRLKNNSRETVSFTLLFIDSALGIQAIFPKNHVVADNLLSFGQEFSTEPFEVTGDTSGCEKLLLIAEFVTKDSPLRNYAYLQQPTLQSARHLREVQRGNQQDMTGFEKLLESAVYHTESTRGLKQNDQTRPIIMIRQWTVSTR